jgi:hypothetical protein
MTYKVTINQTPTFLHAIVSGRNTMENVKRYVEDIILECTASNCWRVLIEERLEGARLGMTDVFDIVAQGSSLFSGMFKAIAFVDVNAEGNLMLFAENVAYNRGFPIKVFSTVDDAKNWLLHEN